MVRTCSIAAVALVCVGMRAVLADEDPAARARLDEVARAYKALPAYSDHGEVVLTVTVDGSRHTSRWPASISLVRPDRLRIDTGTATLVADGRKLLTLVAPSRGYSSGAAPKPITLATVTEGPVGSVLLGGPAAPPVSMVLGLLLADDPARGVLDQAEALSTGPDQILDGQPCQVLKVDTAARATLRLLIDPKTHLLRSIELSPGPQAIEAMFPAGLGVKVDEYRWTAGSTTATAPASAFATEVPAGFRKLEELAHAGKDAEAPRFRVQELVGGPSPGVSLTLFDGPGKTRTVTPAELAGKVVVIDFWATWCGPCLTELPEIQKLIEGYTKARKEVVIVGLSQDDDPKDPVEVRKLIESTLSKKKVSLDAPPVGRLGLDPSRSVGDAFHVEGYPTVVVIDPKGVVRSAHVGFSPDVGTTLAGEIDALLEGRPLPSEGKADEAR